VSWHFSLFYQSKYFLQILDSITFIERINKASWHTTKQSLVNNKLPWRMFTLCWPNIMYKNIISIHVRFQKLSWSKCFCILCNLHNEKSRMRRKLLHSPTWNCSRLTIWFQLKSLWIEVNHKFVSVYPVKLLDSLVKKKQNKTTKKWFSFNW